MPTVLDEIKADLKVLEELDSEIPLTRHYSWSVRLAAAAGVTISGWDKSPASEGTGLEATFYDGLEELRRILSEEAADDRP